MVQKMEAPESWPEPPPEPHPDTDPGFLFKEADISNKKESPLRLIESEFQRVIVGENDIVVLHAMNHLSPEKVDRLMAMLKGIFKDQRVIILDEGLKLGVLSKEPEGFK